MIPGYLRRTKKWTVQFYQASVHLRSASLQSRPGGTGPVGPAIAGPTFELGRIL